MLDRADICDTTQFREARELFAGLRHQHNGEFYDAADLDMKGASIAFTGTCSNDPDQNPVRRVGIFDRNTGALRVLPCEAGSDFQPKHSPDGACLAFLSDTDNGTGPQLHLWDFTAQRSRKACGIDGWVEYHHWSPDGSKLLLGVAGLQADVAGRQGAAKVLSVDSRPAWMPAVSYGRDQGKGRSLWIYDLATDRAAKLDCGLNIWEAVWLGDSYIVAVASAAPEESAWYKAGLYLIPLDGGAVTKLHQPVAQIGALAATSKHIAFVEGLSSDRGVLAGDAMLLDIAAAAPARIDTNLVDITHLAWRSHTEIVFGGHRGLEMVIGSIAVDAGVQKELWASKDLTSGERTCVFSVDAKSCAMICEGFARPPGIVVLENGLQADILSFGKADTEAFALQDAKPVHWKGEDDLAIEGWLLLPRGEGPHPLVMAVHGGPISHWRPMWLGRRGLHFITLLSKGFAVFLPNPRGSSGRGQHFSSRVVGDIGGQDARDLLRGIQLLVNMGIADANRLGVMGVSYGGFMTASLVTQTQIFKAAIPICPHTNQVTEHLLSNIPHFVATFLKDDYSNPGGEYHKRSPVMFAANVMTPTLCICGARDKCTPPEEAIQFHNALKERGVTTALVNYPLEGHGIRGVPAVIDFTARVVDWFQTHLN